MATTDEKMIFRLRLYGQCKAVQCSAGHLGRGENSWVHVESSESSRVPSPMEKSVLQRRALSLMVRLLNRRRSKVEGDDVT